MTPMEIMFALGRQPPFDRLTDPELEIAASVASERHFEAGELVLNAGDSFRRVLILLDGAWTCEERPLPRLLGVRSLLSGQEGPGEVRAGAEGAHCLTLTRGHFFTLVNECPALLLALLSMADHASEERSFL